MPAMKYIITFILTTSFFTIFAQKREVVYRTKGDTTQNYYLALTPGISSKGLLVILPGFGTSPNEVLLETKLPQTAVENGYTVIIPLLVNYDQEDTLNIYEKRLETLIPEVLEKYKVPQNKFIIGGHSLGGQQALYYGEQAFKKNDTGIVKPNLVFGVDPPLDMKRLYDNYVRSMKIDPSKAQGSEAEFIINRFNHIYGGSPHQKPKAYANASAYYRDAVDGGNAKYLRSVPVRLYSDPDVSWFITERNTPIEWTNLADITSCIVQLKVLGNKNAEYISCLGKGFQNGKRHPHGFSMLDADEFILWANKMLYTK
jgi:pimeloyl-ACP methyl ester carboxylesterase